MGWIIELLLTLISWPFRDQDNDRSVVGKSRLDKETERFWQWVSAAALVIGVVVWLVVRQ